MANLVEVMDLEANTSPTEAAQASLQNLGLGEKEKHEKELATCAQLLDQVRGFFGFDREAHSKSKNAPVTHSDLERALQCSSHLASKHAKAYGSVVMQRVDSLKQEHVDPNTRAIATLETKIKALQDEISMYTKAPRPG